MSNSQWKSINDTDFDAMIQDIVPDLPPENIVAEVNPWKKSVNRVLVGMALNAITLNFFCLNYIIPTIGAVLMLLGFRTLRHENRWFKGCFAVAVIRAVWFFPSLIINATIIHNIVMNSPFGYVMTAVNIVLSLVEFICLWRAFVAVQRKAELKPHAGAAVALILWYALMCGLALIQYVGLIIPGLMLLFFVFIIRNLYKLSKELDEAGYVIEAKPVKITDRFVVTSISLFLTVGILCGYIFGGSYPMEWTARNTAEHSRVEEIKTELVNLGFPKYVLNDISPEDISACKDAVDVVVYVSNRMESGNGTEGEGDVCFTGVGVQVPEEKEKWVIIHHFLWKNDPHFYGTESIQLWPTYRNKASRGHEATGKVTGRILYDNAGETFVADYYSLEEKIYTSNDMVFGKRRNTDVFATFSMPKKGSNHRGYLLYPVFADPADTIVDSWFNYTHQKTFLQYPVMTAMEKRMSNTWNKAGAFFTFQDQFQFYRDSNGEISLTN